MSERAIESIKLEGTSLAPGVTSNSILCPKCGGGRHADNNFYVTNTGKVILFVCHRASCNYKGFIRTNTFDNSVYVSERMPSDFKPNPLKIHYRRLPADTILYMYKKYGVTQDDVIRGCWSITDIGMLVFPVFSPTGEIRGHLTREDFPNGKKQIRNWQIKDEPWQCWYIGPTTDILYIVEDQISALRLSQKAAALALLGTNFSKDKQWEVRDSFLRAKGQGQRVILCLDKDASSKAIDYTKECSALFGNFQVRLLSKDVKNMTNSEFEEFTKIGTEDTKRDN